MNEISRRAASFFGERAEDYDAFIIRIVPLYHECNQVMMDLVPFDREQPIRALDIGSGTGVIANLILTTFPNAAVTAMDGAAEMLAIAEKSAGRNAERLKPLVGLFPDTDIGGPFDLVVSSLAFHHLDDHDKRAGLKRIFDALQPGGSILLRDYVLGATSAINDRYQALWREFVQSHGYDDMSWFDDHSKSDKPATITDQLAWLNDAGFEDVACHWQHMNYALLGGRKRG